MSEPDLAPIIRLKTAKQIAAALGKNTALLMRLKDRRVLRLPAEYKVRIALALAVAGKSADMDALFRAQQTIETELIRMNI